MVKIKVYGPFQAGSDISLWSFFITVPGIRLVERKGQIQLGLLLLYGVAEVGA